MDQLQTFKNELFEVAATVENDQILFDVEQVAKCLGIFNTKNGVEYVRWNRVNNYLPKNSPLVAKGDLIPESLVYKLAFKASNEIAEQFQDWLAIDVIPSIRKHGAYLTPSTLEKAIANPDFTIGLLEHLKAEREEKQKLQTQIKEDEPYTKFGKVVSMSDGAINVGAFAKLLYDKHGINIGRNKLMAWLRNKGYLIKQEGAEKNLPKQQYIEQGLFKIRPTVVKRTNGDVQTGTTLITGKGQIKLANSLLAEFAEKAI